MLDFILKIIKQMNIVHLCVFSLKYAEADGIITKQEMEFALLQIRNYVKNEQCTLVDELKELFKREVTFKDTLDIYKKLGKAS